MKRFTHSLLATSMIIAATGMTAQASGVNNERMLTEITAGDYSSILVYDRYNRLSSVESLASKVTFDYTPATVDGEDYDMTMRISDPSGDIVCYLEIGDNGFITKSREIEEYMGEQAAYKTCTFGYDSEDRLARATEVGIVDFSNTEFEYTDGNTDLEDFVFESIEARYFRYAGLLGAQTSTGENTASAADSMVRTSTDGCDTYFSINGMKQGGAVRGINIIRSADGTVTKTLVR